MKTLITGGTGLLGRFLVRRLIDSGDVVRVLVRSSDSTRDLFGVTQSGLEEMTGDLRDPSSLKRALHGMDAVCHCAAHVKAGGPWAEFEDITVKGTKSLLEYSCQEGIKRFLHVSSRVESLDLITREDKL